MNLFALLILLGCWILWIHRSLKISLAIAPAVACSSLVSLLYLFNFTDYLCELAILLWCLGPILLCINFLRKPAKWSWLGDLLKTPILWLGLLSTVVSFFCLKDVAYSHWDEFSHWGVVTKILCLQHTLNQTENAVIFRDYPPGASLWQYFLCLILGYREGHTYVAQTIFLVVNVLPLFERHRFSRPAELVLLVSSLYFTIPLLGFNYYNSLYVDSSLGILQIAVLASYFFSQETSFERKLLPLVPMLFALPTFKAVGAFFALASLFIITADVFLTCRRDKIRVPPKLILILISLVFVPLISKGSWSYHVRHEGFSPTLDTQRIEASETLKIALLGTSASEERAIVTKFFQAEYTKQVGRSQLTTVEWLLLLLLELMCILSVTPGRQGARLFFLYFLFLVWFVFYEYGLLSLYLFSFNSREALKLASFSRYHGLYFLAWQGLFFGYWIQCILNFKSQWIRWSNLAVIMLLVLFFSRKFSVAGFEPLSDDKFSSSETGKSVTIAAEIVPISKRIYLFQGPTVGPEFFYYARYLLVPRISNSYCYRSDLTITQGQTISCPTGKDEWEKTLYDYDYLLLNNVENSFWDVIPTKIAPQTIIRSTGLYQVLRSSSGITLTLVNDLL